MSNLWKVFVVLVVLGLLSGCNETATERAARVAEEQNTDATNKVRFRCVEGYLFVERHTRISGEGLGLAQFWEIGANGQPRPRVCGGIDAE